MVLQTQIQSKRNIILKERGVRRLAHRTFHRLDSLGPFQTV